MHYGVYQDIEARCARLLAVQFDVGELSFVGEAFVGKATFAPANNSSLGSHLWRLGKPTCPSVKCSLAPWVHWFACEVQLLNVSEKKISKIA